VFAVHTDLQETTSYCVYLVCLCYLCRRV
jgi:hypothetical protein